MDVQPPRPGPASATLLVHPADRVRASYEERRGCPSCRRGSRSRLDAIVTDLDGKAVAGRRHRCDVGAARLTWEQNHYRTGEVTITEDWAPKRCNDVESDHYRRAARPATGQAACTSVTATISDDGGRKNLSRVRVWAAGGKLPAD